MTKNPHGLNDEGGSPMGDLMMQTIDLQHRLWEGYTAIVRAHFPVSKVWKEAEKKRELRRWTFKL